MENKNEKTSIEVQRAVDQAMNGFFQEQKKDKVERYRRLNAMAKTGQIVFAGSSLMEQFPVNEMMQNTGVTLPYAIYNRGIGGFTTTEMMEVLDVVVTDLKPKYLFINIGTNDLNGPMYRREELIGNYRRILQKIRVALPDVKIFMMAYYPMCPKVGEKVPYMKNILMFRNTARVNEANEGVKALAEELGHTYLDFNSGIVDENGDVKEEYSIEGMHMYANGYEQVLKQMLPVLQELK